MNNKKSSPIAHRNGSPKFSVMPNGCWNWIGFLDRNGYGICGRGVNNEKYAHRAVYRYFRGTIPKGMTLDHLCRNRSCVNPDHLEPVTLKENVRRSPRTRLTPEIVKEILSSPLGLTVLGKKYKVTKQAIYLVRKGLIWAD